MKVARIERDPRGLTSEVRGKIIDAMMDGELVPGDRLILDTLADQLGVSRKVSDWEQFEYFDLY